MPGSQKGRPQLFSRAYCSVFYSGLVATIAVVPSVYCKLHNFSRRWLSVTKLCLRECVKIEFRMYDIEQGYPVHVQKADVSIDPAPPDALLRR